MVGLEGEWEVWWDGVCRVVTCHQQAKEAHEAGAWVIRRNARAHPEFPQAATVAERIARRIEGER